MIFNWATIFNWACYKIHSQRKIQGKTTETLTLIESWVREAVCLCLILRNPDQN